MVKSSCDAPSPHPGLYPSLTRTTQPCHWKPNSRFQSLQDFFQFPWRTPITPGAGTGLGQLNSAVLPYHPEPNSPISIVLLLYSLWLLQCQGQILISSLRFLHTQPRNLPRPNPKESLLRLSKSMSTKGTFSTILLNFVTLLCGFTQLTAAPSQTALAISTSGSAKATSCRNSSLFTLSPCNSLNYSSFDITSWSSSLLGPDGDKNKRICQIVHHQLSLLALGLSYSQAHSWWKQPKNADF